MQKDSGLKPGALMLGTLVLVALAVLLAGCGSTPMPTSVPTDAPVSPTTDTPVPPTETPVPPADTPMPPTPTSKADSTVQPDVASTLPAAVAYQPLNSGTCEKLADDMEKALKTKLETSEADFTDYISGENGTGCQASASGTGADFGEFPDVVSNLEDLLEQGGWKQDVQYQADGPTGTAMGFKKSGGLCLLSVNWEPSDDAACPDDQPISACKLKPEQKLFTIVLNCAEKPAS